MMLIGLFTSRVILQSLGVADYGVYTAVGGFVAMFSLLSGTLTNSINRFLTFELGRGDAEKLKRVFSTSLNVMFLLSAIVIVLGATLGVWFLNVKMNIPEGRMGAANIVLACSLLTFIFSLISVPYNAAIIAHERMSAFAWITILDVVFKLLVALTLPLFFIDRLIVFAVMLMVFAIVIRIIYSWYCYKHFEESRNVKLGIHRGIFKEMFAFAG